MQPFTGPLYSLQVDNDLESKLKWFHFLSWFAQVIVSYFWKMPSWVFFLVSRNTKISKHYSTKLAWMSKNWCYHCRSWETAAVVMRRDENERGKFGHSYSTRQWSCKYINLPVSKIIWKWRLSGSLQSRVVKENMRTRHTYIPVTISSNRTFTFSGP